MACMAVEHVRVIGTAACFVCARQQLHWRLLTPRQDIPQTASHPVAWLPSSKVANPCCWSGRASLLQEEMASASAPLKQRYFHPTGTQLPGGQLVEGRCGSGSDKCGYLACSV
jgi:hypothetical protein